MKMGIWYSWLEDSVNFCILLSVFFSHKLHLDIHLTSQILQTNVWKVKLLTEHLLVMLYPPKLFGEYNLLPSILTLQFITCAKFYFGKSYLWSDSQTNTVIWPLCLPVKMVSKTVIRPIQFPVWSLCGGDSTRPHLSGHGY